MEVRDIRVIESPSTSDRVRLTATVGYDDGHPTEECWFEVDRVDAGELSESGHPWLACYLPLAMKLGEPLRIDRAIDRTFHENALERMAAWRFWYPYLHEVPIEVPVGEVAGSGSGGTAAFFSGGVDSFFTILYEQKAAARARTDRHEIQGLLTVWGFDIGLENPEAFAAMAAALSEAAVELNAPLVTVATNLKKTRFRQADWGYLTHGGALAAVGLLFEKRYSRLLIGSTRPYTSISSWGSHPMIDPLYSTDCVRVVHHGTRFSRVAKTEFVARSDLALRHLRVCWKHGNERNCCDCNKCFRTMVTLDLLGALERSTMFTKKSISSEELRRVYSPTQGSRAQLQEVANLAREKGREEVAQAIEQSFKFSDSVDRAMRISGELNRRRYGSRLASYIRQHTLKRAIV